MYGHISRSFGHVGFLGTCQVTWVHDDRDDSDHERHLCCKDMRNKTQAGRLPEEGDLIMI